MDFTIYSIGSGAYLHQILMAVVSFTNDGSFGTFIRIGLLLGVLFFAFQAISSGGSQLNVGQLVVAVLLYALMFGPKADVYVHGLYDGYGGAVADVPIGIAMPGAFVSQLGYGLTNKFETAFSGPGSDRGLTDGGGYADALKILNDIRRKSDDPRIMSALNASAGAGSDFRTSWTNYIRECTAIKIDLGEATIDEIYSADDIFSDDGLKFASSLFGTNVISNGNQTPMDCTTAYSTLRGWTESATGSGAPVYAEYKRILGLGEPQGTAGGDVLDVDASYDDAFESIQGSMTAMDALADSATMAQQYVRTSILETIFQEGMAGRYEDLRDFSTASMINSAIDQRNIQWASEQTMFMSIVRPMLTFIEGFAYAITPFMAFIIVLGGFGIKLAMKYGQMLLWIQLWLPVLAITNFFLYMVASHDLAQIDNYSTSFYAINAADARLANWVAVGGMLAAATPILTLVLLTGSSYAMTSLAQRMQGADHVNEKAMSPDTVNQGAILDQSSMNQNSQIAGRSGTGVRQSIGSLNLGEMSQSSVASSSAEMMQASNSLMGSFSQSFKQAETSGDTVAHSRAMTDALASTQSSNVQSLFNESMAFGQKNGLSSAQSQQLALNLANSGSLGTPAAFPAALRAALTQVTGDDYNESFSSLKDAGFGENLSWSQQDSAALASSLSRSIQEQSTESFAATVGSERANQLTEQAGEVESLSQEYKESQSYANAFEMRQSVDLQEAGATLLRSPAARQALDAFYDQHPALASEAQARADQWAQPFEDGGKDMNANVAGQAARLQVASELANYGGDHETYGDGRDAVLEAMSIGMGNNPGDIGNATSQQGVVGDLSSAESTAGGYNRSAGGPPTATLGGDAEVYEHNNESAGRVADINSQTEQGMQARALEDLVRQSESNSPLDGLVSSMNGQVQTFLGGSSAVAQSVENATGLSTRELNRLPERMDRWQEQRESAAANNPGTNLPSVSETVALAASGDAGALREVSSALGVSQDKALSFSQGYADPDSEQVTGPGRIGQAVSSGSSVSSVSQAIVMESASNNGLSYGAALAASSVALPTAEERENVFHQGVTAIEHDIAGNAGVSHDQLTHEQKNLAVNMAREALESPMGEGDRPLNTQFYHIDRGQGL